MVAASVRTTKKNLSSPHRLSLWRLRNARNVLRRGRRGRSHSRGEYGPERRGAPHNARKDQYRFAIGSSSAGNSEITRQPLSVTTTSSSMRAAE